MKRVYYVVLAFVVLGSIGSMLRGMGAAAGVHGQLAAALQQNPVPAFQQLQTQVQQLQAQVQQLQQQVQQLQQRNRTLQNLRADTIDRMIALRMENEKLKEVQGY